MDRRQLRAATAAHWRRKGQQSRDGERRATEREQQQQQQQREGNH